MKHRMRLKANLILLVILIPLWIIFVSLSHKWAIIYDNIYIALTMVLGAFVAGSSPMGGGAVAFPVLSLFYDISPASARNFSLAIQSIGMTSAALLIVYNRFKLYTNLIAISVVIAMLSFVLSTKYMLPLTPPLYVNVAFSALWLAFGVSYYISLGHKSLAVDHIRLKGFKDYAILIYASILGGLATAYFGSGIDFMIYCVVMLYFKADEKVVIHTSILIMAITTVLGFLYHVLVINDFTPTEFNYWLSAVPVAAVMAPFGALLIAYVPRKYLIAFTLFLIVVQAVALFVTKPLSAHEKWMFVLVFIPGSLTFFGLHLLYLKQNKK